MSAAARLINSWVFRVSNFLVRCAIIDYKNAFFDNNDNCARINLCNCMLRVLIESFLEHYLLFYKIVKLFRLSALQM